MKYLSGSELIAELPLILTGPILRRTQATDVTVWIALKRACRVKLQIFETEQSGAQIGRCVFQGHRETAALGTHLHVVAVTARSVVDEGADERLISDRIYAYDLQFTSDKSCSLSDALSGDRHGAESISYFAHQKPTFTLPPSELRDLKIVHGSCRKPHGRGFDALPILDCLIEADAGNTGARPHQLFMTGDQIYGDDVADPLLWLATPLGDTLLGWEEKLPLNCEVGELFSDEQAQKQGQKQDLHQNLNKSWVYPKQLPAGKRAQFTTQQAGFTAGLKNKAERTTSHLLGFGEYCGSYLLAHSPACWPAQLPTGAQVTTGRKTIRAWDKDKRCMEQFLHTLWKVRRLLANIPTYTIFDDHDVSDDWNLNQNWCLRTLGKPLGRRTVQNAMLAYAVFQGWGNTPEQFEVGAAAGAGDQTSGEALLMAAEQWSRSGGEDVGAMEAIATYLGLPPTNPHTGLPEFIEDKNVWIFKRDSKALTWHYTIRSACHEVVVLDTRTWRGYPIEEKPIAPPMLLCPSAFQSQLSEPLSDSLFERLSQCHPDCHPDCQNEQSADADANANYRTFIVAPTNVFGMRALDWIQQWHLEQRKVFSADVGDSWNFHDQALATLLLTLFEHRQDVVVLSGDIHYSSVIHVDYEAIRSGDRASLVQFTASAMKNEELLTQILHTRLKEWLLAEKPRQWVGWFSPPDMQEVNPSKKHAAEQQHDAIDWCCRMEWLRRSPAQSVHMVSNIAELIPPRALARNPWVEWLKFWKARWFQEGREVVGVNNIALVSFQKDVSSQQALDVKQEHYWFSPWSPTQVVCSRFEQKRSR
ncbi:MAG: PhoD-like phosphatase [Phormidesmis sp.]